MADDDYEPALDSTTTEEASVEAEPVVKRGAAPAPAAQPAAAAAPEAAPAKIGMPPGDDEPTTIEQGPKMPRVWNTKSRALFRNLVKKVQAGEAEVPTGDDLEPMAHTPPQPAAAPAPAAAAQPSPASPAPAPAAQPAAAPAAPVTPPPGLPPLPEMPLPASPATAAAPAAAAPPAPDPKHAEREAALAAREAALVEREKQLPDRKAMVERPGAALVSWLKETHGITDPAELKMALADVISEASEVGLDVILPAAVKAEIESRKARRVVTYYTSSLDAREKALADKAAAQEKAAAEARAASELKQQETAYVARLGEIIAPAAGQFPFLHDADLNEGVSPARIVYEVMLEQRKVADRWADRNPGQPVPKELLPNLSTAAQFADKYYRDKAEAISKIASRHQSRLAPAAPAAAVAPAPAPAAASPGGAPGPAPTPAAKPEPAPVEWDASDLPMDRQQRRQAGLRRLVQATKAKQAAGGA